MSSADGRPPAGRSPHRATAIIAPLSVHRRVAGCEVRSRHSAARSASNARSRPLAATPPPISRSVAPVAAQASMALALSTSQTASWKLAATSASGMPPIALSGLHPTRYGRLQSGEREVETMAFQILRRGQPTWETDTVGAAGGRFVDMRATRVGQPEHPSDLVVRLACRVVDRRAELDNVVGNVIAPRAARCGRQIPAGRRSAPGAARAPAGRPRHARRDG